jgi:hypothetical protein
LELQKRTLFKWKPIRLFTDTWILNIHGTKSHCGCICVCGCWGGFKIFFVSMSVKCSIPNNASQQCFQKSLISVWLNIAISKIRCDNLFGEGLYSIHWICPMYVRRSSDMYPCAALAWYKWFQLQWWLHA